MTDSARANAGSLPPEFRDQFVQASRWRRSRRPPEHVFDHVFDEGRLARQV